MSISKRVVAIIISLSVLFLTLATTGIFVVVNHINKTKATTSTSYITTTNLFNTNGTINATAATAILDAVGYCDYSATTTAYKAHQLRSRNTSTNSDASIIFPMGYVNGTSGEPLYWQATYLYKNYLTIWLTKAYNTNYWNSSSVDVSYDTYATSTIQTYINGTFRTLVTQSSSTLQSIFVTPATAGYQKLKSGTSSDTNYYYNGSYTSTFDNMSTTVGNSHYMWLPSFMEVCNNTYNSYVNNTTNYTGLWGLNSTDRSFDTSLYTNSSSSTSFCWLRSGISAGYNSAMSVISQGDATPLNVNLSYGVRPAAHISLLALKNVVDSIGNMLSDDGTTINATTYKKLISALGSYDSTARTAADIRSANSGNPIVFQMGEVLNTTTNETVPIYWQVVYQVGDIITIWMTDCYTSERYNTTDSSYQISSKNLTLLRTYISSSYHSYINYSYYSNYSQSVLRDLTNAIYLKLADDNPVFNNIVKSPSAAGATWQQTEKEDVYTWNSSYYDHHNNLYYSSTSSYGGSYTGWSHSLWKSTNQPYSDKFWIPSSAEVFNNGSGQSVENGLWGLTATDRGFATTTLDVSSVSYCWLRSGYSSNSTNAMLVTSSGSASRATANGGHGVRPACHLSLSVMQSTFSSKITFDQQGGSGGTESVIAIKNSAMPSITLPTRTGYTFGGYYTDTNGAGTQYYNADGTSVRNWDLSGDTTLYAKWTGITYYIAYNGNRATSGSMSKSTHTYGTSKALTANAYSRTGYTFKGWSTSNTATSATYSNGASVLNLTSTNGATVTLYAVWQINSYTISIVSNNADYGTILNTGGTYNYSTTYTTAAAPKKNCAFLYWIDSANPTEPIYDNPLTITVTADKTYTAYFTDSLIEGVSVTANFGGSAEILQTVDTTALADTDTLTLIARLRYAGYQFDGWYIQGESTAFSTDMSVSVQYGSIKKKVVIAKFSKIPTEIIDKINTDTETDNTGGFV